MKARRNTRAFFCALFGQQDLKRYNERVLLLA